MNSSVYTQVSPAKLNLFLKIGKKTKNGRHTIASLMMPLRDLNDKFTFIKTTKANLELSFTLSKALKKCVQREQVPGMKQNLIYKAAHLFYEKTRLMPRVKMLVQKKIPLGGGLGGGSSNAAVTLQLLNRMHRQPLSILQLRRLANRLGSDVSFFLEEKPQIVFGTGEKTKLVLWERGGYFLLVNPKFAIDTTWAYEQWDRSVVSLTKKMWNVRNDELFFDFENFENDFEKVIFPVYPNLKEAKEMLIWAGAKFACLSGSGATVFGWFEKKETAVHAQKLFSGSKWLSWISRGVSSYGNYRSKSFSSRQH